MADKKNIISDDFTEETHTYRSRREFLVAAKKWSKAVVAGAVFGSALLHSNDSDARGWANRRGGGGGWRNGGGGGWRNGGGGWRNRGGGGASWWNNTGGGGWRNGGIVWGNGGIVWGNRGGGWTNGGGSWRNGGGSWANYR